MRISHERVYTVHVERSPGRLFVRVPDLPWVAIEPDEQAVFVAWRRYEETQGRGFAWELDLGAPPLTRRILLPDAGEGDPASRLQGGDGMSRKEGKRGHVRDRGVGE